MRLAYALGVRCFARLRQPSADHPVHQDAKHQRVIQKEEKDEGSGDCVSHAAPPQPQCREQTDFQTTTCSLKFIDRCGEVQESSKQSEATYRFSSICEELTPMCRPRCGQ